MPQPKDKVTVWETFDGKEFRNKVEAVLHERKLWKKVEEHLSDMDEFVDCRKELISSLAEGSAMWKEHESDGWPSDMKKEDYSFLKTL